MRKVKYKNKVTLVRGTNPEILSNYSKSKYKGSSRFCQTMYFKNAKEKASQDSFKNYFKNRAQRILEILSNYIKNKTKVVLEILSTTSKTQNKRFPEILSNYFKNKTKGIPEIFSNYFKNKTKDVPKIV